jgi:tRNA A-37 threonylcarbamoyl transferase component Bud32
MNMDNAVNETMLLIGNKADSKFLLEKTEAGWRLPLISGGVEREYKVGSLQQAASEQLQLKLWIGRRLYNKKNQELSSKFELYEAELSDEHIVETNYKWGSLEDVLSLNYKDEDLRTIIIKQTEDNVIIKNCAPWFQMGWYDKALLWISDVLDRNKYVLNGPIEQVKVSDMSIILRIPVVNSNLYFKATGLAAKYEARLSKHLSKIHEAKSVGILDINEKEGWLLMSDLGGASLRQHKDKILWQKAINEYAQLQLEEAEYIETLISMGVPDRRLHVLKDDIDKHLAGMCATGLDQETTARVMALKPELMKMCDEMEGVVPYSIEHGDLHTANIHLVDEEVVFFDWGDATISHPFFSTRIFWHSLDDLIASENEWLDMVNQFRPYYLEPWTKFAPMEKLEKLLLISDQLACVNRALSWYLYITPNREDIEDSFKKPSQWLQLLLEHRELIGVD